MQNWNEEFEKAAKLFIDIYVDMLWMMYVLHRTFNITCENISELVTKWDGVKMRR